MAALNKRVCHIYYTYIKNIYKHLGPKKGGRGPLDNCNSVSKHIDERIWTGVKQGKSPSLNEAQKINSNSSIEMTPGTKVGPSPKLG